MSVCYLLMVTIPKSQVNNKNVPPDHYPNVLMYDIVRVCTYLVG
jgi:hypothetical protein